MTCSDLPNWAKPGESPKWILSLDGGGFRGVIAAQILIELEYLIQKEYGINYKLSHFFDLIAGTSTGSIIAAGLACGMSVDDILKLYMGKGKDIFKPKITGSLIIEFLLRNIQPLRTIFEFWETYLLLYKYSSESLGKVLVEQFKKYEGGSQIGFFDQSGGLITGLMVVVRNATNGEPVYFCNHQSNNQYKNYIRVKLSDLVRASCAAPKFFSPHSLKPSEEKSDKFIDGGIGIYNNPAYQAFLEATESGENNQGLGWNIGVRRLFIISIGTGYRTVKPEDEKIFEKIHKIPKMIDYLIKSLMSDAQFEQVKLMERLGVSPYLTSEASRRGEVDECDKEKAGRRFSDLSDEEIGRKFCYIRLNECIDRLKTVENLLDRCFGDGSGKIDQTMADEFFDFQARDNSLLKLIDAKACTCDSPKYLSMIEAKEYIESRKGKYKCLLYSEKELKQKIQKMDCIESGELLRLIGAVTVKEKNENEEFSMMDLLKSYNLLENKPNRRCPK